MFFTPDERPIVAIVAGINRQTVAYGERAHVIRVTAQAGASLPLHSHPHEQIGTVLSGAVELTLDGETRLINPGEGYVIPGGVQHSARFEVDAVLIEVFAPVREEYLP